jgi:hypothetical protein
LDLVTGRAISELNGHKQLIESIGFSPDGKYAISCSADSSLRIWDFNSGKLKNICEHNNAVNSFSISPNGKFIVTRSKDKTIRVIDASTEKTLKFFSGYTGYFLVDNEKLFLKTNDNSLIAIEIFSEKILYKTKAHNGPINHISVSACGNYALSSGQDKTIRVWGVNNGLEYLVLENNESEVYFAEFSPDLKFILTQSESDFHLLDFKTGEKIRTHKGQFARFCNNTKYYVSLDLNKKFTIWNYDRGIAIYEKILLLNDNWLVKLPASKYYMCSKGASKMLHYVTPELKVIGFEQLDPIYNRPDIILENINKFINSNDTNLIKQYKAAWLKRINLLGLDNSMISSGKIAFPRAEIENSEQIVNLTENGNLQLKIKTIDPENILMRFNVFVNEVPCFGSGGISLAHLNTKNWDTTLTIPLSLGDNKLQISVINQLGLENFKFPTYIKYENENIKPKTIFVGIGVNEFYDSEKNLKYCVKDVGDLAETLRKIPNSEVKLLLNKDVIKENIISLKQYLTNTSVHDKVIISCSSHGLLDSLNFYLAMYDTDFKNPSHKGLSYYELENLLDGIPARKRMLLIDACNSGDFDKEYVAEETQNDSAQTKNTVRGQNIKKRETILKTDFYVMKELFINTSNTTGSYIISATSGLQNAIEGIQNHADKSLIENGAFTYAILEYINNNKNSPEKLTVNQLKQYVERRVVELTNGNQNPTSRKETMEIDWNLW